MCRTSLYYHKLPVVRGEIMKKFFYCLVLLITMCAVFACTGMTAKEQVVGSDNCYMVDFNSGRVLYAKGENDRKPIASMVKIMTLLLTFENVDSGKLSLDQKVTISHDAAKQVGSEMFLDEGQEYPLSDLVKGIVTMSANDASVAVAELIAGDEVAFTNVMNERAKSLGMNDTLFANATGYPTKEEQYSTAKDVTCMMRELAKHKEYYNYSTVWLEDYTHPSGRVTQMANTNKLIRHYKGCDGGKTGYTDSAKFCLAGTATRNGMRVVGSVLGANDSKARFRAMSSLFNYSFNNFKQVVLVKGGSPLSVDVKVSGGKKDKLSVIAKNDLSVLQARGENNAKLEYNIPESVKAPINCGDKIGEVYAIVDGKKIAVCDILAGEEIKKASIWDYVKKIM